MTFVDNLTDIGHILDFGTHTAFEKTKCPPNFTQNIVSPHLWKGCGQGEPYMDLVKKYTRLEISAVGPFSVIDNISA